MKNTASWLGFLKVRAGWGQNGNDNIPNSNWRAGYEFGDYGLYTFGSDKNGVQPELTRIVWLTPI